MQYWSIFSIFICKFISQNNFLNMIPNIELSIDVVGIGLAIIGAAVFIHRKIIIPTAKAIRNAIYVQEKIDHIYKEFHSNGGGSIRDAINRIEVKLVGVEQKQNMYLLESPQGIFETNSEGRFISVNRTLCRLSGRTEKELLGMGWINSINVDDRTRVVESWHKSISNEMEFIDKFYINTPHDKKIQVNIVAYPLESPTTKKIIGWLGTINKVKKDLVLN